MANDRKLVRIEYRHMVKTIKSLRKLIEEKNINESTRRHAQEVIAILEKELELSG